MDLKFISYDGCWPNLCSGTLVFELDGKTWEIERLSSGGSVWFDSDWGDHIESGPWDVSDWPEDFPEEHKWAVVAMINYEIPQGCCGGCI